MKILLICSVESMIELMHGYLTAYLQSEHGDDYTLRITRSIAKAKEALRDPEFRDGFDLFVVDQTLDDGTGSDFVTEFCEQEGFARPYILMSGRVGFRHPNLLAKPFKVDQLVEMIECRRPKKVKPIEPEVLEA